MSLSTSSPTITASSGARTRAPRSTWRKKAVRRLADHVGLASPWRIPEPPTKRPDVETQPVLTQPEAVLLERDQLGTAEQLTEGPGSVRRKPKPSPRSPTITASGSGSLLLESFELLLDLVPHEQRDRPVTAVAAALHRQHGRGERAQRSSNPEAEAAQLVERSPARMRGGVRHEAESEAGRAELPLRLPTAPGRGRPSTYSTPSRSSSTARRPDSGTRSRRPAPASRRRSASSTSRVE